MTDFLADKQFHRISRLPPYVFAEVNALKAAERKKGNDIIDFGMGNPDTPTPPHIVEKLRETVLNPDTHRYSVSQGIPGLRKALAGYYSRRFNIDLDPNNEVVCTIGSKEGLANLATAISKPGDVFLVPSPSYPIHPFGFIIAEASVKYLPKDFNNKDHEGHLLRQIKEAMENSFPKPSAIVLNYPCNPTAECVTLDFYREVVSVCKHYELMIISDLAYNEIYFDDNNPPPSILQVPGAKEIAIEFTTLSKTYSMAGWRVGFAAGNKHLCYALKRIKSYLDYGTFTPIQVAAATALNGPQDCVAELRQMYKERRDTLCEGLHQAGWNVDIPQASMFVWGRIPEKFRHLGSLEFSKLLMTEAQVAVAPGIGFGIHGDEFVRIGLIENKQRIRQATRSIKQFLAT
jgi:alanine-synthesizing transaminase